MADESGRKNAEVTARILIIAFFARLFKTSMERPCLLTEYCRRCRGNFRNIPTFNNYRVL